ncbi:MAG: acyl-CoA dehydratase activase [Planctomycetota bacterium]
MGKDRKTRDKGSKVLSLGLDIGSVNLHGVLLDRRGEIRLSFSLPLKARPQAALAAAFKKIIPLCEGDPLAVGVTGAGREMLRAIEGITFENEIIASTLAASKLAPWARSLMEVGGHFSKWMVLDENHGIVDYALNEFCAAGSGAFLEQQASRLGITLADLATSAANAPSGAAVAGRCSVFAKSDMIHLQQKGTPLHEIAYGVCLALARNYAATVLKGREPTRPVALIGGAAANPGLIRALREVLSMTDQELIVPEGHNLFGAMGAAMSGAAQGNASFHAKALSRQVSELFRKSLSASTALDPLPAHGAASPHQEEIPATPVPLQGDLFLGVDVGSVSTDFVLINEEGAVLAGVYLPTRGQPIAVIEEGLARLRKSVWQKAKVLAAATTGSGRHLAAQYLQADAARNEITAQLQSTLHYFPDVDTIFEIGGQDSKYISVKQGRINDFMMNKICAAGTGSFLEEQAVSLGLDIIREFEEKALSGKAPVDLGSRCTVFMDTELVHALQRGAAVEDVAAGLAYSVAQNYLDKVVANRPVGKNVVFQGGVASNRAVVAAFSRILGREIRIHPYNRLSGAIGAALIAREMYNKTPFQTTFSGFESRSDYKLTSFECPHCTNTCQVTRMEKDKGTAFFGDVCERYTSTATGRRKEDGDQDLAAVRERILKLRMDAAREAGVEEEQNAVKKFLGRHAPKRAAPQEPDPTREGAARAKGTIGIPRASLYFELFALFAPMWENLGYEVIDSGPSSKKLLDKGVRRLSMETCLPMKLAFSHVVELEEKNPDFIFLPSILDLPDPLGSLESCSTCPYTQSLPYMVSIAPDTRFLIPQINLSVERDGIPEGLEILIDQVGVERKDLKAAFQKGKNTFLEFKQALLKKGEEVLASGFERAVVLIGKPYNLYDTYLNMNLVRHLTRMGMKAIPYEFIAIKENLDETWDSLPWRFNRDYIKAALTIRHDERLYPVVVSNFGCGPDGFTFKHLERIFEGKPALFLEFDEHRGEAGLVTRLEAFADEVASHIAKGTPPPVSGRKASNAVSDPRDRKFFIPNFADHAYAYAAALRYAGIEAEVLPPPDNEVRRKGEQFSSGKECHPYSFIAGDLVKLVESISDGDRPATFFFPGTSIPCLLPQYGPGFRLILEQMDESRIEVMAPAAKDFYELLGLQGGIRLWRGLIAMDLLVKASCELRPYERKKGTINAVHRINCQELARAVEGGDIVKAVEKCIKNLSSTDIDRSARARRKRPVVGVAGDIYTRTNKLANRNLFTTLEELGCEVWPSPFIVDVFDFGLKMEFARSLYRRDMWEFINKAWVIALKELSEQGIRKLFQERFRHVEEPGYKEVVAIAAPYVGERSSEVLMLNIAKMVDFAAKGADGIINAMCFNCMVGSVSAAMTLKLRRDNNNIPIVNLVLGGTEGTAQTLRLEAFIHQVKEFAARKQH